MQSSMGEQGGDLTAEQKQLWEMTLEILVSTLEEAAEKVNSATSKLTSLSKDLSVLKGKVDYMITNAKTKIAAESQAL